MVVLIVSDTIITVIGMIPLTLGYPFNNWSLSSGYDNLWELILVIAYHNQMLFLIMGIVLLTACLYLHYLSRTDRVK